MAENWWKITQSDTNAWRLETDFDGCGTVRRFLFLADLHWDNAHCRLDLLKATLDEAKAEGAPVFLFGDTFCAMQGKWDPRSSRSALREEHHTGSYLDSLVSTAVEWFKPYASSLAMISYGNHETSILKRHQVDLCQQLVGALRRDGSPVVCGTYWGFVVAQARLRQLQNQSATLKIHYHHGSGGGAEVTRGFIDHNRTRSMYGDFDVGVYGHIHRRNCDENIITTVTARGKIEQRPQLFLRCSTWKDESLDGWHVQQGRAARPIGGWWLELVGHKQKAVKSNNFSLTMRALPT